MSSESSALIPRGDASVGGNAGFAQQGAVDWTRIGQGVVTLSVDSMARLSRAGIDAITLHAGYAVFARARLSVLGEARVQSALDKLRAFPSVDKALWFGFGVKHIVHEMRESREGVSCIAVCAALTEMYSVSFSAKVLRELFLLYNPPQDLTPAIRQWHALVETSAGVLAQTEFSLTLNQLTKHYLKSQNGRPTFRESSTPTAVAVTMRAIFDISTGQLDSIDVVGGPDCGLLAMVGHWLLGISTEIQTSSGLVLFRSDGSTVSSRRTQLTTTFDEETSAPSQVVRHRYLIPSGSVLFPSVSRPIEKIVNDRSVSFGRPAWETCLADTLGESAHRVLTTLAPAAGLWLGSVATILETTRCGSASPKFLNIRDEDLLEIPLSTAVSRRSFCSWALKLLPELRRAPGLAAAMERSLRREYGLREAMADLKNSSLDLSSGCRCQNHTTGSHEGKTAGEMHEYCFLSLMLGINHLIRVVSGTRAMAASTTEGYNMRPAASGILRLFVGATHRVTADDLSDPIRTIVRLEARRLFQDVLELFTGRGPTQVIGANRQSAVSQNGICFFLGTLVSVTEDARQMGVVCMTTGAIQSSSRQYNEVVDDHEEPLPKRWIDRRSFRNGLSPRLIVEESTDHRSFDALVAYYLVAHDSSEHRIGPAEAAWRLNRSSFNKECHEPWASCPALDSDFIRQFRDIDDASDLVHAKYVDHFLLARDQRGRDGPWLTLITMDRLPWTLPKEGAGYKVMHIFQSVDICFPCCVHIAKLYMHGSRQQRDVICVHTTEDGMVRPREGTLET